MDSCKFPIISGLDNCFEFIDLSISYLLWTTVSSWPCVFWKETTLFYTLYSNRLWSAFSLRARVARPLVVFGGIKEMLRYTCTFRSDSYASDVPASRDNHGLRSIRVCIHAKPCFTDRYVPVMPSCLLVWSTVSMASNERNCHHIVSSLLRLWNYSQSIWLRIIYVPVEWPFWQMIAFLDLCIVWMNLTTGVNLEEDE